MSPTVASRQSAETASKWCIKRPLRRQRDPEHIPEPREGSHAAVRGGVLGGGAPHRDLAVLVARVDPAVGCLL
jgi:hypothetical protein